MTVINLLISFFLFTPQPAPQPKASVEGRILNSVNGQPIGNVIVFMRPAGPATGDAQGYAEDSDSNGRFRIPDVAPGEYFFAFQRQGYMLQQPGGRSAPPMRVTIEAGQQLKDVVLRLAPPGVIVGHVLDQDGDPVRGATVYTMTYAYLSGKRELQTFNTAQSNDKGDFRIFNVAPGTYYVQAAKRNNMAAPENIRGPRPPASFIATYYPSALDVARAVPVEVAPGAQMSGIDVRIRHEADYVARFKIPARDPNSQAMYSPMISRREGQRNEFVGGMRMMLDKVEFPGLLPGSYAVTIVQIEGNNRSYAHRDFEILDQDYDGGALVFLPPTDISATVTIEGTKPAAFPNFLVSLIPNGPSMSRPPTVDVKAEGAFTIHDVAPGAYRVQIQQANTFYIKAMLFADQPLTDHRIDASNGGGGPLTILLGTDMGEIEGSVKKSNGDPAVNTRVSALAYGDHLGNLDYSRTVFTDAKGHFVLKGVPPAEFKVFAWEDVEQGAPQDPEFRKPFEKQGVTVKLAPYGHESIELTSIVTANSVDRQ